MGCDNSVTLARVCSEYLFIFSSKYPIAKIAIVGFCKTQFKIKDIIYVHLKKATLVEIVYQFDFM